MCKMAETILSIKINRDSEIPIYKQLKAEIDIISVSMPSGAKLPPLRKIADALSVSYLTVTKGIDECIKEGTLKGVRGSGVFVADKMSNLKRPVLVCTGDFRKYMCASMLQGIDGVLKKNKVDMLVYSCETLEIAALENITKKMVAEKRISGIVGFSNLFLGETFPLAEIVRQVPMVIMDCRAEVNVDAFIRSDDKNGMTAIVDALVEKKHKNVLYLSAKPGHCTGEYRLKTFLNRAKEKKLKVSVIENIMTTEDAYLQTMRAFVEGGDFSAISCWADSVATGVIKFLNSQNIKIPSDVSLTGYGNLEYSGMLSPSLTTVEQNFLEIGEKAAELLLNALSKRTYSSPVIYETQTRLIIRDSLTARNNKQTLKRKTLLAIS